jgi:hypothetical protein
MKRGKKQRPQAAAQTPEQPGARPWLWIAVIVLAVTTFYWIPLTSDAASIQWDAADLHYPLQKYFSDHLRAGNLPFWTPYAFSGSPFLANVEAAAWYPPHWPFYLLGITPRAIQWELFLHALIACLGGYFLILRHVPSRPAAAAGAICYGLSGFFSGHSSHVALFSAAAVFPWLLLAFRAAWEGPAARFIAGGGIAGGLILLAGYPQTAAFSFAAAGLYATAHIASSRRQWLRGVGILAGMTCLALTVAAIQLIPAFELVRQSPRGVYTYATNSEGSLMWTALATLLAPNAATTISGEYALPTDITQTFFYAGILLLPLAALGMRNRAVRLPALFLIVPTLWYMAGPSAGLYRLAGLVPPFRWFRAPIQAWFVVALGLALLAAAGAAGLAGRFRMRYLGPLLVAILFADVLYWNSWANPTLYARASFYDLYGHLEELTARDIAAHQPSLSRFAARLGRAQLGPLDHALNLKLEATYGYFAMTLAIYHQYLHSSVANPRLLDGLNVSRTLNLEARRIDENPSVLPRAYFPKSVREVVSPAESMSALATLDPATGSVVMAPHAPIQQDPNAEAQIVWHDEQGYRIRYRAASPSLLRLSVPWYPGWKATIGGREQEALRVDHALMGFIVPAGAGEVLIRFRLNRFGTGAALSLCGLLSAAGLALYGRRRRSASLT